jgi:ABC-type proline/glycine betaine transport system substrate-binding protein
MLRLTYELNANKDRFNGEIIGIGGGAGLHRNTIKAMMYTIWTMTVTVVDPAMVASLEKAIRDKEWIVTGWKPHFKYQHDLKYLKKRSQRSLPKTLVQLFLEEGLAIAGGCYFFQKPLTLKKNSCNGGNRVPLQIRGRSRQQNGMKQIKIWLTLEIIWKFKTLNCMRKGAAL